MPVHLRNLHLTDIKQIIELADNNALADDMVTLPIPFTTGDAKELIDRSNGDKEEVMGVIENENNKLAGVIMLRDFEPCHEQAEMSIWIGEPFWGKGFGTAAISKMAAFGFNEKNLNRIYAYCMVRNVASQRILKKSGFTREGLLRERVIKHGKYEDVYIYSRLKKDI